MPRSTLPAAGRNRLPEPLGKTGLAQADAGGRACDDGTFCPTKEDAFTSSLRMVSVSGVVRLCQSSLSGPSQ